jgi:hypothetical protein
MSIESFAIQSDSVKGYAVTTDESLIQQFEDVTLRGIEEGKQLFSYNPTRYLQIVRERGALGAAKQVLRRGPIPDGFVTLAHINRRPDLATEYTALMPEFQELFTEEELTVARERLGQ